MNRDAVKLQSTSYSRYDARNDAPMCNGTSEYTFRATWSNSQDGSGVLAEEGLDNLDMPRHSDPCVTFARLAE